MWLLAESLEVEAAFAALEFVAQRRQTLRSDTTRAQQVALGAGLQLEIVAWTDAQGLQYVSRERDLALGRDADVHTVISIRVYRGPCHGTIGRAE